MPFNIEVRDLGFGMAEISVFGELEARASEEMERTISQLFKKNICKLVINLENLEYISSAGAGVFLAAWDKASENNGNIIMLHPPAMIQDVFETLGLSEIFTFANTLEEAIKMF